MFLLAVDDTKCTDCVICSTWSRWYNGGRRLLIGKTSPEDEDDRKKAEDLKEKCPEGAILFKQYRRIAHDGTSMDNGTNRYNCPHLTLSRRAQSQI